MLRHQQALRVLPFVLAGLATIAAHAAEQEGTSKLTNIESSYPAWSPDGKKIVFQSDRNGGFATYNPDIYIMNADGTGLQRLTHDPSINVTPVWSPDGRRIAYQSHIDGNPEIYVIDADGLNPVNVSRHAAADSHPKWSADGTRFIFDSDRSGNDEIYLMNADGTNVQRLTNDPGRDTYASLSPDGKRVLWRRRFADPSAEHGYGDSEVFVMNLDGSGVSNLTAHPAYDGWPAWSPDGSQIAFSSDRSTKGSWHIYTMSAAGGEVTRVTPDDPAGGYFTKPVWSPDGTKLLCTRTSDGNVEIFLIEMEK